MKIRFSFRLATIMVAGVLLSLTAMGQDFQGGYFLGGYNAAFRMNPAIQNERSIFALGLGNIGVGANSNQVGPDTFLYDVNGELLSAFDRKISADTFLGKLSRDKNKAGVNMNLDVLTLGFWSGRNYWTVDVRARAGLQACVPYDFFSLLKAPSASSSLDLSGTALGLDGILETAVGVSHNFDNKFNIGGRIKFLYGALSARVALDQMTASCATDTWTFNGNGSASFSSQAFKVKTDESGNLDVGEILDDIDVVEGLTNPGGIGAAIDLGATWNVLPWLTLSGALLDIGGMKWNRNIMGESPSGLSWKMVPDEDGHIDGLDALDVLMSFKNTSSKGSSFSMMPLTANLGAEARIPSYDRLSFGLLTSFRHSQVSNWGEGRLSANWNPGNALGLSLSTTVNNFGQFLGFAFNLHPGGINLFMGADYLPLSSRRLSYYTDDDDMPSILKNLGIPTNRLNVNVYFGLNLAFGKRHLDHTGRIID